MSRRLRISAVAAEQAIMNAERRAHLMQSGPTHTTGGGATYTAGGGG
jgi:hypothetical protein